MYFRRSYPGHRFLDYLATMYLIDRYLDLGLGRERQRTSEREANTPESRDTHDPLLYMAMGYMAAQSRDPVIQYLAELALINYLVENRQNNYPSAIRNFEITLERRVVIHGPINYSRGQNSLNYMYR